MTLIVQSETRLVFWTQIVQAVLCVAVFVLAIVKFQSMTIPSRTDIYPMIVSIKSLVVIAYEFSAEHFVSLRRFASLRAYMILGIVEVVFWFAALVVGFLGLKSGCASVEGAACMLGGVIIALVAILLMLSIPVAAIAWRNRKHYKRHNIHPDDRHFSNEGRGGGLERGGAEMTYTR